MIAPTNQSVPRVDHPEDSLEAHLARHSRRSEAIYLSAVALLLGCVALLPVLRVDVAVQAAGIVRPLSERREVRVPTSGFAIEVSLPRSGAVEKGDPLVRLKSDPIERRLQLLEEQIAEERDALADLALLLRTGTDASTAELRTPTYVQQLLRFSAERGQAERELAHAQDEVRRLSELVSRELIPRNDLADAELRLGSARSRVTQVDESYRIAWSEAATQGRGRMRDLLVQRQSLHQELSLLDVRAPIDGTLEEVAYISPGAYLRAGDFLATISPRAELVAEVFVDPGDVGLIRSGMPARLLIDAFNYNDWGVLTGRIRQISHDYVMVDGRPMFRAEVELDGTELRLDNGFRGRLRKGMTLHARFTIARRSLWQLLRDDLDNWLNPARQPG